ncbi:hypothetical protein EC95JB1_01055 [Escherichia coli]|nr:hypothetical protein EC95JB1_01055 [Escherichia coli]EHW28058.1 hypothetical protein ECDEC8E_2693 [Escherichia coli DEC8E]
MAIFHLDFKIVKRSEGMTSVAKAAYHARTRITDDRIGETYDFSHRTDLHGHIILYYLLFPHLLILLKVPQHSGMKLKEWNARTTDKQPVILMSLSP